MDRETIELMQVVRSDLHFLQSEFGEDADDNSLRRNSNILRRLLIYGELQKAWINAGFPKQPQISYVTLNSFYDFLYHFAIRVKDVTFASAGGAVYKGMTVAGAFFIPVFIDEKKAKYLNLNGRELAYITDFLSKFQSSSCLIVLGKPISRDDVVKYVANKLGGTHYDPKRNLSNELEDKYARLDALRERVELADKDIVYYEFLSIGQFLVQSPDIQRLLTYLDENLPPE